MAMYYEHLIQPQYALPPSQSQKGWSGVTCSMTPKCEILHFGYSGLTGFHSYLDWIWERKQVKAKIWGYRKKKRSEGIEKKELKVESSRERKRNEGEVKQREGGERDVLPPAYPSQTLWGSRSVEKPDKRYKVMGNNWCFCGVKEKRRGWRWKKSEGRWKSFQGHGIHLSEAFKEVFKSS